METQYTSAWVSFFTAAGIPTEVGATYAITFAENRIQNDMLLDLNKEYLRDMGISRMGDVIAILRHAKKVHENTARDKVLSSANTPKVPVAAITGRITNNESKPGSPATRMLEHYTRNTASPPAKFTHKRKLEDVPREMPGVMDLVKKARKISFGPELPPGFKNKNPLPTVFARLGTSSEAISEEQLTASNKNIFQRLGIKDLKEVPKPTQDALEYEGILKARTEKTIQPTKPLTVKKQFGTMRADEAPVSIKDKLSKPKSVKFSSIVEYKEIDPLPKEKFVPQKQIFNKPERRLVMPKHIVRASPKVADSVKSRLGVNAAKASVSKALPSKINLNRDSVFSRLGKT